MSGPANTAVAESEPLPPSVPLEEGANWLSFIFMTYLDTLFAKGDKRALEMADLGPIPTQDRADILYEKFNKCYAEEMKKPVRKRSLWNTLWRTCGYWKFVLALLLFGFNAALQFGPVFILTRLVRHFQGVDNYTDGELWLMVCLLLVFPIVGSLSLAHSNSIMAHVGCQFRNVLIDVIYRKALVISPYLRQTISTGRIITMFSADTNMIRQFLFLATNAMIAPLQIGACLYLIYQQVGVATFVGLGYTVITTPVTGVVFGIMAKLRAEKMVFTDSRVKLMNEILNGIRIIKYYAWEKAFISLITKIRADEIKLQAKSGYIFNFVFGLILLGAPQIQTVLVFFTYIMLGNQLDAATAFTTLTLFGLMTSPFIFLPYGIQQYNTCKISIGRITEFLAAEELRNYVTYRDIISDEVDESPIVLEFSHADMSWTPQSQEDIEKEAIQAKLAAAEGKVSRSEGEGQDKEATAKFRAIQTLQDINIKIRKGDLVVIVGAVGCGKSSMLSAILGEMYLRSGDVFITTNKGVPPTIAYCDQRPWIVNATVRENIIFGKDYDEERFQRAIDAASMHDDLEILPGGEDAEIGEKGINLSGGQKARVALARAIYQDADIILLDDPLSAVDAHVGEHIFKKGLLDALSGKTRLLVTHHLHVLPDCDMIIILNNDGTVLASGTYDEISRSGIDVSLYIKSSDGDQEIGDKKARPKNKRKNDSVVEASSTGNVAKNALAPSLGRQTSVTSKWSLISKEEKKEGSVTYGTYWQYILYGGWLIFFVTICAQLSCQALTVGANFWLADWGKETNFEVYERGHDMSRRRSIFYLNGYAGIQMASVFLLVLSRLALTYHRTLSSAKFQDLLLKKALSFPVSFFDITPIGRVINRFSQDIAVIDEDIAQSMSQVIGMGGGVLGAIGGIVGATKGTFLILLLPLGILYQRFQAYFRKSNTAISRLESVSRSPIYADFSQTLAGTSTIRAYAQQSRYIQGLEDYANLNTVPGIFQQIVGQWLAVRLDILGGITMFFMGALAVSLKADSFIPAGYLALGLSYAIQMTSLLKMAVRVSATLEAQFNAVERVNYYISEDHFEAEHDVVKESVAIEDVSVAEADGRIYTAIAADGDIEMNLGNKTDTIVPPENWPSEGKVEFADVRLRYRNGPLVLKGVSFVANANEKIGIAGRTGCGKSSLMVALFRIENLYTGSILIDGIDISKIPLHHLRKKLSIIPQDPVMFSASVRFNLDPFDESSDQQIWDVLASVKMKEHVESLPGQLTELVVEGGDNFSAGQRQLICIARAILRKPKVLVLDEATASIDSETDALIQAMLRTKFVDCTVLTIAHRLNTIVDSTRILVMDSGVVGEFDSPDVLLNKTDGIFRGLWERHLKEGRDSDDDDNDNHIFPN